MVDTPIVHVEHQHCVVDVFHHGLSGERLEVEVRLIHVRPPDRNREQHRAEHDEIDVRERVEGRNEPDVFRDVEKPKRELDHAGDSEDRELGPVRTERPAHQPHNVDVGDADHPGEVGDLDPEGRAVGRLEPRDRPDGIEVERAEVHPTGIQDRRDRHQAAGGKDRPEVSPSQEFGATGVPRGKDPEHHRDPGGCGVSGDHPRGLGGDGRREELAGVQQRPP